MNMLNSMNFSFRHFRVSLKIFQNKASKSLKFTEKKFKKISKIFTMITMVKNYML